MWPNPQETVDLVTFAKEILNGKTWMSLFPFSSVKQTVSVGLEHHDVSMLLFHSIS